MTALLGPILRALRRARVRGLRQHAAQLREEATHQANVARALAAAAERAERKANTLEAA